MYRKDGLRGLMSCASDQKPRSLPALDRNVVQAQQFETVASGGLFPARRGMMLSATRQYIAITGETAMKREHASVKASFVFSVVLSGIAFAANVVGAFATASADVGMTTFICFLPLAFFMAQNSHQQTRKYIEALEARVHQLEVG